MADPIIEIFQPTAMPVANWSAAANWSAGLVPCAGVTATITGITAVIDPGVTIEASVALTGTGREAVLSGNGGAVVLGQDATVAASGATALFANDAAINHGKIAIDGGAVLTVVVDLGAVSGYAGAPAPSFANSGTISVDRGGALAIGCTEFENAGLVTLNGATLALTGGALGGFGTIDLAHGATAYLGDGVANQTFDFGAGGGTVVLDDPLLGPAVTFGNFGTGDTIALPGLAGARIERVGDSVGILDSHGVLDGRFTLDGAAHLSVFSDGTDSEIIAYAGDVIECDPPCFARGTRILTPSGYRPVEQLVPGDLVITASGKAQPIIWTGLRLLDLAAHPTPKKVQPIRISAGALAPCVPRVTLRVSPDHALWFNGVLIPAKLLVNDATIIQESDCLAVTYHHVELDRHDVLLAEDAQCESYLDTGNRAGFGVVTSWLVRTKCWNRDSCAPLCTQGSVLAAVRRSLHERAIGLGFTLECTGPVTLRVDGRIVRCHGTADFILPAKHCGRAEIHSPRFVPASVDPGSDDRRTLGVALAGIRAGRRRFVPEDLALDGFHPRAAGDTASWTNGAGLIRLPLGTRRISLELNALPVTWRPDATGLPRPQAEARVEN